MASRENIQYGCFILLVSLILSTSRVRFSGATDTLLQQQLIKDGETLISANQTFELGFFSAGNSSKRYVGIWFHKVPMNSSVWIANRENPLADRSGTLTFDGNGSLVITDGRGGSFVVASSSRSGSMAAVLLDSGNLVVRDVDDSSRVFWESFDHPTDTYLPGMKLKVVGGKNRGLVTSWTNSHDPSPGDFSLGLDPSNPLEFLMWKKGSIYWTTGPWNGMAFANLETNKALNYDCYFITYVAIDNERYFTYSLRNGSIILKLMLDYTGHLKQLQWDDSTQDWISIWSQPSVSCDVYDYCGSFGSCSVTRVPPCQCLQGFQPGSLADWSEGNFSRGCVRRTSLQCGNGAQNDRFLMIPSIKFPAKAQISSAGTEEDCQSACLNNCSCTAYAFAGGCTLWHGDLVNLRELREEDTTGNSGILYLRLAASELRDSKGKKKVIVAIAVPITLFVLTLLLCFVWLRSHKGKRKTLKEKSFKLNGGVQSKIKENESGSEFLFDFSQILDATENFSNANKLGQGGFGPVYKGQLPEGQEIAVKRLSARSAQGLEEFENEIALIAQLQHRNLVRLLGYCIQGEEKILIYEYMPNKSLDHFLFDPTRAAQVDWGRRFHIIEGIAQGLLYLHKHSRLRIIHRDLKASNILLDGDMNPRISDFGMARIFGSDDAEGNTKRVVGTYGYMPPEYALEGLFSVKSDVFSFGVLLLEIVSGKRNAGFHQYGKSLNLLGYAWDLWKADKWLDLVDPSLSDTSSSCELSKSIQVALLCVQENAADRPTMTDVITMFSSSSITLPDPKQPAFFSVRIATEEEPSPSGPEIYSLNDITFSIIDGR